MKRKREEAQFFFALVSTEQRGVLAKPADFLLSGLQSPRFAADVKCHLKLLVLHAGKAPPFSFLLRSLCFHFDGNVSGSTRPNESPRSSEYSKQNSAKQTTRHSI